MCFCKVFHGGRVARAFAQWCLLLLGLTTPAAVCAQRMPVADARAAVALPVRLTALDSANGFHQCIFGTRLSDWPISLESLQTTKQGQLLLYLPAEPVLIGNLLLRGLRCSFYTGRLARLDFAPTSEAEAEELLGVLQERYGPGQPAGDDQVTWTGQVVTLVHTLVITARGHGRQVDITRHGQVSLLSNALLAEMQAERAASRRPRKSD